jgi:ubiquinone/menaquinone biosynthesis C-methylase UbiE
MHEMMLGLALESCSVNDGVFGQPLVALDIGCGTGAEAISLLRQMPNLLLVGVDLCQPMLDKFTEKATEAGVSPERYILHSIDILESTAGDQIRQLTKKSFATERFNIILSAFTLHHFETTQKAEVFRLVLDLLQNNGIFLFGDLFNYKDESSWLTDVIQNWELSWIAKNFEDKANLVATDGKIQEAGKLLDLKDEWLHHYLNDNRLGGIVNQMQLLRNAGFYEVGNPFRYWQVGLLWARKRGNV